MVVTCLILFEFGGIMSVKNGAAKKPDSLGYPLVEELLENENFESVNKSFSGAFGKLQKIFTDAASGLKKQKEARKAMEAYELTTELIRELLKLKYQLLEQQKKKTK